MKMNRMTPRPSLSHALLGIWFRRRLGTVKFVNQPNRRTPKRIVERSASPAVTVNDGQEGSEYESQQRQRTKRTSPNGALDSNASIVN
jgi:hypothetical protein